jgi:tetratricopeptide (TPR) repeat protein
MLIVKEKIVFSVAIFWLFLFVGISLNRAGQDETKPSNEKSEEQLFVISSLSDMMLTKENLPKDWKLLEKRVEGDSLVGDIEIAKTMFAVKITDTKSQPLQIGKERFNVDMLWVEQGMDKLMSAIDFSRSPLMGRSNIKLAQKTYEKVLIVISAPDEKLLTEVKKAYSKLWYKLIEKEVDKSIKDKKEGLALQYFRIIYPDISDIGRGYLNLANDHLDNANAPSEALKNYEKTLSYIDINEFDNKELWTLYKGIGLSTFCLSDWKRSETSFLKSYEIAQKMKDNDLSSESSYNLARTYAEMKNKEKAYRYLETSFKLDKEKTQSAIQDSSFKELQKEIRFKNLIKKYEK